MAEKQFFVYGTLKVGGTLSFKFDEFRETCINAKLANYAIYDLGWFPGIIPENNGEVFGEIHTYNDDNYKDVLNIFDRIEGYNELSPEEGLYIRKTLIVTDENDNQVKCNCYILNQNRRSSMAKFQPIAEKTWDVVAKN